MDTKKMNEVFADYTAGKIDAAEANKRLEAIGSNLRLNPDKNNFTPDEIVHTTAGSTPAEANGYGLLDTGTGSFDKVQVKDGHLVNCDCGEMYSLCIIGGKTYHVKGTSLVD